MKRYKKRRREELLKEHANFHERIQAIEEGFDIVGGSREEL